MHRNPSVEYFSPSFASPRRRATLSTAVFSLVSTIIGGGALSLPLMIFDTGIIFGLLLILMMAIFSSLSLDLLISCSRRHHRALTYESVAQAAFGSFGHAISLLLLFSLLFLAIIAYLILIRDLLPPCLEFALGFDLTPVQARLSLILAVIALFPLCLARSLQALSFTSTLSVVSMIGLAVVIAVRGSESSQCSAEKMIANFLWPRSSAKLIASSGIAVCSFCCVFNTLSVHSSLILPTRSRVRTMLNCVMLVCCVIYLSIAVGGLCLAGENVEGNILLNFAADDKLATIGRIGLLMTVVFSLPLLVLPCRDVCEKILLTCRTQKTEIEADEEEEEEEKEEWENYHTNNNYQKYSTSSTPETPLINHSHNGLAITEESLNIASLSLTPPSPPSTFLSTFLIVMISLILSMFIPSVASVWSFLGGGVSVLLSFSFPCAFYLRIRAHKEFGWRHFLSWSILFISSIFIIANSYSQYLLHNTVENVSITDTVR